MARTRLRTWRVGALLAVTLLGACSDEYVPEDRTDRRPRELRVTQSVGGTNHRTLVADGVWYQARGPKVMALDPRSAKLLREEEIRPVGTSGAAVDMILWKGDLMVVLENTGVARLDRSDPKAPVLVEFIDASTLGIKPRWISEAGGELWVSGDGGAVRLRDRAHSLAGMSDVGPVVLSAEGLVAPVERRVLKLQDGSFVGAASLLVPLPPWGGVPGGFAFVLQGREAATVGVMGPDVREVSNSALRGRVHSLRLLDGRLWAVTDLELASWVVKDGALTDPFFAAVKGARDVALITPNYYAVAGSFGRAVFRFRADPSGAGDEFIRPVREPGRADTVISDKRTIVVSSPEGTWSYPIRGTPVLTERKTDLVSVPQKEVSGVWGSATLVQEPGAESGDYRSVRIRSGTRSGLWKPASGERLRVLEVVDGDLWVGRDGGITVLRRDPAQEPAAGTAPPAEDPDEATGASPMHQVAALDLEGPITYIFPLRTGSGASFVSRWGGMGVAEWVPVGEKLPGAPSSKGTSTASKEP